MRSRPSRCAVVLLTSLSIACGGRGCGSSTSSSTDGTAANGNQALAADLREPLAKAQQELATALGLGVVDPEKVTTADLTGSLERALESSEAAEHELARDTFDVEAVAKQIGPTPVKLFEWVRDNTYLVPYKGVLRGSTGVLMDRLGNSLDRALLLADLLRSAGAKVRLAHATLSPEQAVGLLRASRPIPTERFKQVPDATQVQQKAIESYAAARHVDAGQLRQALDRMTQAASGLSQGVEQRVSGQVSNLAKALPSASHSDADAEAAALESLRDHWWVQHESAGTWIGLDPSVPDAVPGRTTFSAADFVSPADLGDDLFHQVDIRIVVERWDGDKLEESSPLNHAMRLRDVIGQRIELRHRPLNWPTSLELQGEQGQASFRKALAAQKEWQPVLRVGTKAVARASFTDTGELNVKPGSGTKPAAAGGATGGLLGGLGGEPAQAAGVLTAEWIEFEIHVPGGAPQKIRREVFDLVGPSARTGSSVPEPVVSPERNLERAMALLQETEILLIGCQLSQAFAKHMMHTSLLADRETLKSLVGAKQGESIEALSKLASQLNPVPRELYALALGRHAWSPVRNDVYLDRPNILSFHKRIGANEKAEIVRRYSLDIVANYVAVRRDLADKASMVRMTQGVADTTAELLSISSCGGCRPVQGVSELWTSAAAQGTQWVLVQALDDPAWRGLPLNADARKRIENDIQAGYVVLVPPKPIEIEGRAVLGWWRLDPKSGTTLGMMEGGEGQGLAEYPRVVAAIGTGVFTLQMWFCGGFDRGASTAKKVACFLCSVYTGAVAISAMLGAGTPVEAIGQLVGLGCGAGGRFL